MHAFVRQQREARREQYMHVGAAMTALKNLFSLLPHRSLLEQSTYSVAAECVLGKKK